MKTTVSHMAWLALLATLTVSAAEQNYVTSFDGSENPLFEAGAWIHTGLDWAKVVKINGVAYGTQTGSNGYDDSYAILSGYPPDQSASAVAHRDPAIDLSCSREVEILMRWEESTHNARGYECGFSFNRNAAAITRWNGPLGSFNELGIAAVPTLKDGDNLSCSIVGNVITMYVNSAQVLQVTDSAWAAGNPGVGFFRRACGTNSQLGFTSFTATGTGVPNPSPNPPTNVTVQ